MELIDCVFKNFLYNIVKFGLKKELYGGKNKVLEDIVIVFNIN